MVSPGILPLSIIRGIEFPAIVLQCRDEDVVVTGTLNPNVTGTYVLSGTFNSYPLFILDGAPSTFLYFHPIALSYIISRTLSTGVFADYWLPAAPITEPTGTYLPQGGVTGTAVASDHPVDLTGYTAEAEVRRTENPEAEVYINLNPSVSDPPNGEITLPAILTATTKALEFTGDFKWDLVLTNAGERVGVFIKGPFTVSDNITQP